METGAAVKDGNWKVEGAVFRIPDAGSTISHRVMQDQRNRIDPPEFALRFLRWFCPDHLLEEIEGDRAEIRKGCEGIWRTRSKRRLVWKTVRFLRPGIILRNKFSCKPGLYAAELFQNRLSASDQK